MPLNKSVDPPTSTSTSFFIGVTRMAFVLFGLYKYYISSTECWSSFLPASSHAPAREILLASSIYLNVADVDTNVAVRGHPIRAQ